MGIELPLDIVDNFDKVLRRFDGLSGSMEKSLKSIERSTAFLAIEKGAELAFQAIGKVAHVFVEMVDEASEAQDNLEKMNNALVATGSFSEQNSAAFRELADELSRTSRFANDVIISQVAVAKQFGLTNREAAKLIRASVDLSAVTGQDLNATVRQLGQTFDGTAGRMAQMFPELQALTAAQLRNGAAVDVLGAKYKGFAERGLGTFRGQIAQAVNAQKDLFETLGSVVVENQGTIVFLNSVVESFRSLKEFAEDNRVALADFVSGALKFGVDVMNAFVISVRFLTRELGIAFAQVELLTQGFVGLWQVMQTRVKVGLDTISSGWKKYNQDLANVNKQSEVFDKASDALSDISVKIEMAAQNNRAFAKSAGEVSNEFDNIGNKVRRINPELKQQFEDLAKSLKDVGRTELQTLENAFKRNQSIIEQARAAGIRTDLSHEDLLHRLKLKNIRERAEIEKKLFLEAFQNPLTSLFTGKQVESIFDEANTKRTQNKLLGVDPSIYARGLGLLSMPLKGREGATNFLAGGASAIAEALGLGPLSPIIGDLVKQLSAGPDAVKKMITEFADALPDLITNVIEAIPEAAITIFDKMPEIIDRMIDRAPEIIQKLVENAPRLIAAWVALTPRLIAAWVSGAAQFVGKILGGAGQFVGKILEGATQFVGKIIEGAGKFFEKAAGSLNPFGGGGKSGIGSVIGAVSGGLGPGGFLGAIGGGAIGGVIGGLFKGGGGQAQAAGAGQPLVVNVQISNKQLAQAIVDLQRAGFKVTG